MQADRAGWESTIKRMIAKGAKLDKAQVEPILGYLSAKSAFETKCNTCHDLQRPLTAIKNPEQWKATVAADGGHEARAPGGRRRRRDHAVPLAGDAGQAGRACPAQVSLEEGPTTRWR